MEPDSTLGDSVLSDNTSTTFVSSFTINTSGMKRSATTESIQPLDVGDTGTGSPSVSTLIRERSLLITLLEAMRSQQAQMKTHWKECFALLDRHVTQLNRKMSQDAEVYRTQQINDQAVIDQLKDEVCGLKESLEQSRQGIRVSEAKCTELTTQLRKIEADWSNERMRLDATVKALTEQAENVTCERNQATEKIVRLEQEMTELRFEHKSTCEQLLQREREIESHKDQVREYTLKLNLLQSDRERSEQQLHSMSNELQAAQNRVLDFTDQLTQCQAANLTMDRSQTKAECHFTGITHEQAGSLIQDQKQTLKVDKIVEPGFASEKVEIHGLPDDMVISQPRPRVPSPQNSSSVGENLEPPEMQNLKEQLSQKNQIIRMQQKRLKELQRVCHELLSNRRCENQAFVERPNAGLLATQLDLSQEQPLQSKILETSHCHTDGNKLDDHTMINGSTQNLNGTSFSVTTRTRTGRSRRNGRNNDRCASFQLISPQSVVPISIAVNRPDCRLSAPGHLLVMNDKPGHGSHFDMPTETINWHYLRHVLIKFLLSREREAMHLIRVITKLLNLTADEEHLLRMTLQSRSNWWSGRRRFLQTLPDSITSGQFAKVIPPP